MRLKSVVNGFASLAILLFVSPAFAADVTLTWSWPDSYCPVPGELIGEPLELADIAAAEIYVATSTIPRVPGACGTASDVPPSGAIIQQVTTPDTSVTIDLQCGMTYFFVMRLQDTNGEWSNFSAEAQRTVDCGRPGIPIIISLT